MNTLRTLKEKISDEIHQLHEAFFAAQERLEEGEWLEAARSRLDSLGAKMPVKLSDYRQTAFLKR